MINEIRRGIRERYLLHKYIHPFVRSNEERVITASSNICLFCQPRGGSAWLSEIIATLPGSGIMDEPLWSGPYGRSDIMPSPSNRKLKEVAALDFYYNQPIPEQEHWLEAYQTFEKLFKGQQESLYLYEEMDIRKLYSYITFIAKFNKANLLFHWLRSNFDFKSIVLLRHPCATISSQILGNHFNSAVPIPSSITPQFRYSSHFEQYAEIWKSIKTHEEYLAFIWSVNIKEVVNHVDRNDNYLIVCYEGLLTQFDFELERIFRYLEQPIPTGAYAVQKTPSPTTKKSSLDSIGSSQQLGAWRECLPQTKVNNILRVVRSFGLDFYDENVGIDYEKMYSKAVKDS